MQAQIVFETRALINAQIRVLIERIEGEASVKELEQKIRESRGGEFNESLLCEAGTITLTADNPDLHQLSNLRATLIIQGYDVETVQWPE